MYNHGDLDSMFYVTLFVFLVKKNGFKYLHTARAISLSIG